MDSLRNLPIILRYEDDGMVVALCPLLPDCHCKSTSRKRALSAIQKLIHDTLATNAAVETPKGQRYEVVLLAVVPSFDSGDRFSTHLSLRPEAESPRIEVR